MSKWIRQQGFTLLELMVALAIFAMLAVTGWQIMDSLTKSRDRAKLQINAISALQFAYLQLGQDLAQTSNYVAVPTGIGQGNTNNLSKTSPTFTLNSQGIVFKRFAIPDPRLASPELSPAITQVSYQVVEDKLIKRQWDSVVPFSNENAKTSVLLSGISGANWTALTPMSVTEFPDVATLQKVNMAKNPTFTADSLAANNVTQAVAQSSNSNSATFDLTPYQQLPKGVQLAFTYQDEPIVWRFALPNQAPTLAMTSTKVTPIQGTPNSNLSNTNNAVPANPISPTEREDYR